MKAVPSQDSNQRPLKVLHLVSAGSEGNATVNGLLLPLLLRGDRRSVQSRVVHFAPGHPHAGVVRQAGIPVHEIRLSKKRWSPMAVRELVQVAREFSPDVIHAWGHTATLAGVLLARLSRAKPRCVSSLLGTEPLSVRGGLLERSMLKFVLKVAGDIGQFVFPSEVSQSRHRRAGFPESRSAVIAAGVDVERFKPDFAARKRVRDQLELPANAFVIGMQAPFQPEFDHITFFKAAGEIIRANPHARILLAGRGLQRGNAPLMALVGGGTLATRVQLLGEWSDTAGLFNACDVVVSTALTDELRLNVAMAMLCGVPCIATGVGAQGEIIGKFGIGVEPGGEASLVRGLTRIMEMPAERRAFMARGARQNALARFNLQQSIDQCYSLYRNSVVIAPSTPEPVAVDSLTAA